MMSRSVVFFSLLCILRSLPALAQESRIVAVIPLDVRNGKLDAAARMGLEETLRTIAGDVLVPRGYNVLTGETTLKVLADNGVDPNKACEASCALEAAKEMKARLFISGSVATSEGEHLVFVRLFDSVSGNQLASVKLEGATIKAVRKQFEEKAEAFFDKGLTALQSPAKSAQSMAPARKATYDPRTTIIPGVGINGIVVGKSTPEDVLATYGQDAEVSRRKNGEIYKIDYLRTAQGKIDFERAGREDRPEKVEFEEGAVSLILVSNSQKNLRTTSGCSVGSKLDCFINELGQPTPVYDSESVVIYRFNGLETWIYKGTGQSNRINIIDPRRPPEY